MRTNYHRSKMNLRHVSYDVAAEINLFKKSRKLLGKIANGIYIGTSGYDYFKYVSGLNTI